MRRAQKVVRKPAICRGPRQGDTHVPVSQLWLHLEGEEATTVATATTPITTERTTNAKSAVPMKVSAHVAVTIYRGLLSQDDLSPWLSRMRFGARYLPVGKDKVSRSR